MTTLVELVADTSGESAVRDDLVMHIVSVVRAVCVGEVATFWPAGGAAGFAWKGEFGPATREAALESVARQLRSPTYVGTAAVFPVVEIGAWRIEVVHPSPPAGPSPPSLSMTVDRPSDEVVQQICRMLHVPGATPEGQALVVRHKDVTVRIETDAPSLNEQLTVPAADSVQRLAWQEVVRQEVGSVGARFYADSPLCAAAGADSLLSLFRVLSSRRLARGLAGWEVRLFARAHVDDPVDLLSHLSSVESREQGYVEVLRRPMWSWSRRARLGPDDLLQERLVATQEMRSKDLRMRCTVWQGRPRGHADPTWKWCTVERPRHGLMLPGCRQRGSAE